MEGSREMAQERRKDVRKPHTRAHRKLRAGMRGRHGKQEQVRVLVGTRKGVFIFTSDPRRRSWKIDGPHIAGQAIYHVVADSREERNTLFAAVSSGWFGSDIHRSGDGGRTWQATSGGLRFAEDSGLSTKCVWHIRPGRASEPGVLYAGVDPAGLFKSEDGG